MATTTTSFLGLTTSYGLQNPISYTDFNADVDAIEDAFASRVAISVTTANYTLSTTEYRNKIIYVSGTLTGNRSVIVPLTTGAHWVVYNNTSGSYTLTVIGATGTGIAITQGCCAIVYTDGTNVLRATPDVEQDNDLAIVARAAITVTTANYTLAATESRSRVIVASGALTGNRDVVFPLTSGAFWIVYNNTSGSYTLTCIGASGTGIVVTQGSSAVIFSDGTNILRSTPDVEQDGDLAANTVNSTAIEDASQNGRIAATVADANVIGGLTLTHRIDVAAGATGNVDVVFTYKSRVVDVRLVKKSAAGGGAGTIQVFNGTGGNAITDAMSINVNDKVVVRCAEIDDAYHEIAAGATVRVTRTRTASTDETCTVYIETIRVA